jgi:hypothetical protein
MVVAVGIGSLVVQRSLEVTDFLGGTLELDL